MVEHETFQFVESRAEPRLLTHYYMRRFVQITWEKRLTLFMNSVLSFACSASTTTSNRKKLQKA